MIYKKKKNVKTKEVRNIQSNKTNLLFNMTPLTFADLHAFKFKYNWLHFINFVKRESEYSTFKNLTFS